MMLLSVLCRQSPPPYDPSPNPSDIKSEIEGLFARSNAESDPFKRYQFYLKACDRFQLFCDLRAEGGIHQSQSMLDLARRVEEIGEKSGVATNAGAISSGSYHMPMIANFLAKKLWMYEAGDIQTESLPGALRVTFTAGKLGKTLLERALATSSAKKDSSVIEAAKVIGDAPYVTLELATDGSHCRMQFDKALAFDHVAAQARWSFGSTPVVSTSEGVVVAPASASLLTLVQSLTGL